MSITKSYNKHTNKTYAYDTQYIWNEDHTKRVQKRTCIGQIDPITGEVIPNGKRGRPQKELSTSAIKNEMSSPSVSGANKSFIDAICRIEEDLQELEKNLIAAQRAVHHICHEIDNLSHLLKED